MKLEPLINRESLEQAFGKNPFNLPTEPDPDPIPDPDPAPCTEIYIKDADGNNTNVFANDVMFVFKIQNFVGTLVKADVLDIIPACMWYTVTPEQLLSRLSDPYNCMGIANYGAGATYPDMSTRTMNNIGTGYCKSN